MMLENTDEYGRLRDFRCHDGLLISVELLDSKTIKLRFRRIDGKFVQIVLDGVCYFSMNRFLEGNIVDSAYLWPVSDAPKNQRQDALTAFSLDEPDLDRENKLKADKLFVIECSYGATIHALVHQFSLSEHM
jgi:hypothetical protein